MAKYSTVRTIKDAREALERTGDLVDDAKDLAVEYYDNSREWLKDNYGKALGGVAVIAAAGLIGYFIGKKSIED